MIFWILTGAAAFLVLHKALEGIVTASGNTARRKYIYDLSTAGLFAAGLGGLWVAVLLLPGLRQELAGPLFLATPVVLAFCGIFAYVAYIAAGEGAYEEWAEQAAARDRFEDN